MGFCSVRLLSVLRGHNSVLPPMFQSHRSESPTSGNDQGPQGHEIAQRNGLRNGLQTIDAIVKPIVSDVVVNSSNSYVNHTTQDFPDLVQEKARSSEGSKSVPNMTEDIKSRDRIALDDSFPMQESMSVEQGKGLDSLHQSAVGFGFHPVTRKDYQSGMWSFSDKDLMNSSRSKITDSRAKVSFSSQVAFQIRYECHQFSNSGISVAVISVTNYQHLLVPLLKLESGIIEVISIL